MNISIEQFQSKEKKIAVIGLGYVGLPLAVELNSLYDVIGFDVCTKKIQELTNAIDRTGEVDTETLKKCTIQFTDSPNSLKDASIIITTVPTPIDSNNKPDLTLLKKASKTIGEHLTKGSIVVYESTVYPGVTESICAPIIEAESGLTLNKDFYLGYSPERLSPGEKERTITKITKVVSGSTPESANLLNDIYKSIIPAGTHLAASIKVAEAAKVIENTQRDLNVALMNELSIIFSKLDIPTIDVIEAASTKWNFMKMTPGLVGGHCIGVDPYYLTYKAEELGYHPEVILAGRRINDNMGKYVAEQTIKKLILANKKVNGAKILIMGMTFKENVADIRNSKVYDIIKELKEYGVNPVVTDPHADTEETSEEYGIALTSFDKENNIDAIIYAVNHASYSNITLETLKKKMNGNPVLIDIKSRFKNEITSDVTYFTL